MRRKPLLLSAIASVLILVSTFVLLTAHVNAPLHQSKTATNAASTTTTTQTSSGFDKTRYSLTDPTSMWVIVNKQHPLNSKNYAPSDLTNVGNSQYMRAAAAAALLRMLADARSAGYLVIPASGYRSYDTQVSVYNNEVKANGQTVADSESARPGYSEHQTGLAIDLASDGCSITDCFGNTPGGKWVTANAYKYGFLLRYPTDKVDITGYRSEAWHFRYIGTDLSNELHNQNVKTLEEFFGVSGGPKYQ